MREENNICGITIGSYIWGAGERNLLRFLARALRELAKSPVIFKEDCRREPGLLGLVF